MSFQALQRLAVPGVLLLICFLSFSSQHLFSHIDPGTLTVRQSFIFNSLVISLLVCYARCCTLNPGVVPSSWTPRKPSNANPNKRDGDLGNNSWDAKVRGRWCRKCETAKPPRAHHCRTCKRCIPKMDHHCVWIQNCVSHRVYPHFTRFLFFAVAAMSYLGYLIYIRVANLWSNRHMPSYHGPSVWQLCHLFGLIVFNCLTLFALTILLGKGIWSLGSNMFTIEGWEMERHETLLRRARVLGGYLNGPNGVQIKIERQEFPYDIGIWQNFAQGMGTKNILAWFWPFAASMPVHSGLEFAENDFEGPDKTWPPPDPDRIPMDATRSLRNEGIADQTPDFAQGDQMEAFRMRQEKDMTRWNGSRRRKPFVERLEAHNPGNDLDIDSDNEDYSDQSDGEEGWRNSEGEKLADFGVEQDVEFYDEDDIPLGQLAMRRQDAVKDS